MKCSRLVKLDTSREFLG